MRKGRVRGEAGKKAGHCQWRAGACACRMELSITRAGSGDEQLAELGKVGAGGGGDQLGDLEQEVAQREEEQVEGGRAEDKAGR